MGLRLRSSAMRLCFVELQLRKSENAFSRSTFCLGVHDSPRASATLMSSKAILLRGTTKLRCHGRWSKSEGANLSLSAGLQLSPSSMAEGFSSYCNCGTSKATARGGFGTIVASELCLASYSLHRHHPLRSFMMANSWSFISSSALISTATSFRVRLAVGSDLDDEVVAVKIRGGRFGGGS